MSSLRSLVSLLMTTGFLLAGHGVHMTLLPLRASELGLSAGMIGFSASAYYAGFFWGAILIPPVIARVGHIRSFTALLGTFLVAFLLLSFTDWAIVWILMRFILGAVMCGSYTVIESWLTDQSDPSQHGRVLSVYTMIVLGAMALGQFLLQLANNNPMSPFIMVAILCACAIIPVSLTRSLAPAPVPATRFNFSKLYRRSHTAFAGALGSGIIMGSFWSLGALYAVAETGDAGFAAAFIAATIVGGVFSQYPIGLASDKIDRRFVLAALSLFSAFAAAVMVIASNQWAYLFTAFCFGAVGNSLYAVALAKAADNSRRDEFVTIGSSVLLLNAIGASLSSLLFGWAMREFGSDALFICIALSSLGIALFIGVQPRGKTAVSVEDQAQFIPSTSAMAPAALSQDPRGDEDAEAA